MRPVKPACHQRVETCVEDALTRIGKKIVLGIPLGLGKPNNIANEFFRRACADPSIDLTLLTALTLEKPSWTSDLERRFLEPFLERVFAGCLDLEYAKALRGKRLPPNVEIREFFFKPGSYINVDHAQQNYVSSNYTHAARDTVNNGCNVVAQLVCKAELDGQTRFSLSCNPEVSLDIVSALEAEGRKYISIAEVNQNLPFMYGDAVVDPGMFDLVLDNPELEYRLFGAPKMPITTADFMIGLHSSALIRDDGTLQIGIGSLGDALVYGLILRQKDNATYNAVLRDSGMLDRFGEVIDRVGGTGVFDKGLYGSTEMLVDGYLHLLDNGIIKRKVYDHPGLQKLVNDGVIKETITREAFASVVQAGLVNPVLNRADFDFLQKFGFLKSGLTFIDGVIYDDSRQYGADLTDGQNMNRIVDNCLGASLKNDVLIHAGFFLGPQSFYSSLKNMSEEERRRIYMTSVSHVNQLYGSPFGDEEIKLLQRKNGRFVNAALMLTLTGAVVSDGLESGQVVSGVGGQYNFVSQAHALPGARSILLAKSTRGAGKDMRSNVVLNYGHTTIPRHLRDIVVTEYGIAELRSRCDREIIAAMLNIADSRFQDELLEKAKKARKISADYRIPDRFRSNCPQRLEDDLKAFRGKGLFQPFPFGTDFTKDELIIAKALRGLKEKMAAGGGAKAAIIGKAMTIRSVPDAAMPYLERLSLDRPGNVREKMMRNLVIHALAAQGSI